MRGNSRTWGKDIQMKQTQQNIIHQIEALDSENLITLMAALKRKYPKLLEDIIFDPISYFGQSGKSWTCEILRASLLVEQGASILTDYKLPYADKYEVSKLYLHYSYKSTSISTYQITYHLFTFDENGKYQQITQISYTTKQETKSWESDLLPHIQNHTGKEKYDAIPPLI